MESSRRSLAVPRASHILASDACGWLAGTSSQHSLVTAIRRKRERRKELAATPRGTKSATRRATFAHVASAAQTGSGVATFTHSRATKPTRAGGGVSLDNYR